MNKAIYLSRRGSSGRKSNGQFTRAAIELFKEKQRDLYDAIMRLKRAEYTSPAYFGMWLMSRPRHKFKHGEKSVRFQKVFNY